MTHQTIASRLVALRHFPKQGCGRFERLIHDSRARRLNCLKV
jgi:hypothetical protein